MAVDPRKQTGFRCDPELLTEFQVALKRAGTDMSPVLERWIAEFMEGKRGLTAAPLPASGECPICESTLNVTPKGFALVQVGPLEPMTSGEIPAELMGLVRGFIEAYSDDPVFRTVVTGILEIRSRKT